MKKMPFFVQYCAFLNVRFFCASPHKCEARITVVFDGEMLLRGKRAEYINKYIYIYKLKCK